MANSEDGIGRVYVLRRGSADDATLPAVLGFYTLSMANAESAGIATAIKKKLPRYPMPVTLIGRLAVDQRAKSRGFSETLLLDALKRILDAAEIVGCTGIIVDAKDESARFYAKYGFVPLTHGSWPQRMFLPISTARAAFEEE